MIILLSKKPVTMKKICFLGLLLICACKHFDTRSNQKKAEELAKHYLDSALNGRGDFKTMVFGKVDSVLDNNKHQVKGWSLYASYQGNDAYGAYEVHKIIISIDSGFNKVLTVNDYRSTGK